MAAARPRAKRPSVTRPRALQLLVELEHARPGIWRRLIVPDRLTLADLHRVMQLSMGWFDCHLHVFKLDDRAFGPAGLDEGLGRPTEDEASTTLASLGLRQGSALRYDYDFGDGWRLALLVEELGPPPEVEGPWCEDGSRAGPLEDCGGPPGLDDLLDALANPKHARHKELRGWVPAGYDPAAFSVAALNSAFVQCFGRR